MKPETKHFIGYCILSAMCMIPVLLFIDLLGFVLFGKLLALIASILVVVWFALSLIFSK